MPIPAVPLHEHLRHFARSQPTKPAYLWYGQAISYGELDVASDAFAARLAALGVKAGDPVALFLGNCPQYVMAHLGIQKLGAVVCPCGPLNKAHEPCAPPPRPCPPGAKTFWPSCVQAVCLHPCCSTWTTWR